MHLTRRELWLGFGLGIFAAVWVIYALFVSPALERIETLNRVIPEKQGELEALRARAAEFVALRDGTENIRAKIASQEKTFQLLPFVDGLVQECGLSQKNVTMKPQTFPLGSEYVETVVLVEMKSLTLQQLFDFLVKLKSSEVLANTKTLHIRKNLNDASLLDSEVEISNLKLSRS